MQNTLHPDPRRRTRLLAATIAVALHAVVGLLLLRERIGSQIAERPTLVTFDLRQPRPVVRPIPPPVRRNSPRPKNAAAPQNLRQEPSPIVAPPPIVPIVPPPIVAAPVAGVGARPDAGAATVAGPGMGAGGEGDGRGGGGRGGSGNGDDGYRPPRQIGGRIRNSDYPAALGEAGARGRVSVRYLIGIDGRVSECTVTASSGNAELDATTCRLITQRFRFRPSRGPDGRAVPSYVVENHSWLLEDEPRYSPSP